MLRALLPYSILTLATGCSSAGQVTATINVLSSCHLRASLYSDIGAAAIAGRFVSTVLGVDAFLPSSTLALSRYQSLFLPRNETGSDPANVWTY